VEMSWLLSGVKMSEGDCEYRDVRKSLTANSMEPELLKMQVALSSDLILVRDALCFHAIAKAT
jgi:hypothetical protein